MPPVGTANASIRVNGGAEHAVAVTAAMSPAALVSAVNGTTVAAATGGALESTLTVSGNLALSASGHQVVITYDTPWTTNPTAGDTLVIPLSSVLAGGSNQNVGGYVVQSSTANSVTATKESDAALPGAVPGAITSPVTVSSTPVVATTDVEVYGPITIKQTSAAIVDGVGKTLEINQLTTGTDLISRYAFQLGTLTAVSWLAKSGTPIQLISGAEGAVTVNLNRQVDNVQESLKAGGAIALKIGYTGTSCAVVVGATTMTFTVAGGAGANLTINLKKYPTLSDLAKFINAQTGYSASVGATNVGQQSPLGLDEGTFAAGSTFGNQTLRLKMDAVSFFNAVSNSALVQVNNPLAPALAGLPAANASVQYLVGGTRGATTDAIYDAALVACEAVKGNFVVPLFSQDASADIINGDTDSGSTYTIANIHAVTNSHCLALSTLKRRKNRICYMGFRGTFQNALAAAANISSARSSICFQDVKAAGANGIQQFQPHMLAVLAASMQAAGFYRSITHKGINCSGILQAAGDFKDSDDDNQEAALTGGLLFAQRANAGGFQWVADQTTYSRDNSFVYNSSQAMYDIDLVALTTAQRMEQMFVGQALADVSAALALAGLEAIMADLLRVKLIAPSDDAPKGFLNAVIRIKGPDMLVNVQIKLDTEILFIPINFLVTQVVSSAQA